MRKETKSPGGKVPPRRVPADALKPNPGGSKRRDGMAPSPTTRKRRKPFVL